MTNKQIVPTLSGRRHGTLTADEQALSIAAAQRRIHAGYFPPELPDTEDKWTAEFKQYAQEFQHVLKQRMKDSDTVNESHEEFTYKSDALHILRTAIDGKDVELIKLFHEFLIGSRTPEHIEMAAKVLATLDRSAILTEQHIETYTAVVNALTAYARLESSVRVPMNTQAEESFSILLTRLCFEDVSYDRTAKVVEMVQRGIIDPREVREALEEFTDVSTPLFDGAL